MTSPTTLADFLNCLDQSKPPLYIAYNILLCTGLRPSLTSGNALLTITLIAYERYDELISSYIVICLNLFFPKSVFGIFKMGYRHLSHFVIVNYSHLVDFDLSDYC